MINASEDQGTTKLQIEGIPSFGRYLSDYQKLFALDLNELRGKFVLDCASGGASFPCEANKLGINVVAVDPLFFKSPEDIAAQTRADIEHVCQIAAQMLHLLVVRELRTFEEGMAYRMAGNKLFLEDLVEGTKVGRYVGGALPKLPFESKHFDLSLLGHLLFCYGDRLSYQFHVAAVEELMRVTRGEARIYPLRGLDLKLSPYLEPLRSDLENKGIVTEIVVNDYQEVRDWKEILVLRWKS